MGPPRETFDLEGEIHRIAAELEARGEPIPPFLKARPADDAATTPTAMCLAAFSGQCSLPTGHSGDHNHNLIPPPVDATERERVRDIIREELKPTGGRRGSYTLFYAACDRAAERIAAALLRSAPAGLPPVVIQTPNARVDLGALSRAKVRISAAATRFRLGEDLDAVPSLVADVEEALDRVLISAPAGEPREAVTWRARMRFRDGGGGPWTNYDHAPVLEPRHYEVQPLGVLRAPVAPAEPTQVLRICPECHVVAEFDAHPDDVPETCPGCDGRWMTFTAPGAPPMQRAVTDGVAGGEESDG